MSLIQDALKRKAEETGVTRPSSPVVPVPGKSGPGPLAITLITLAAAAITASLIVLALYPMKIGFFEKVAKQPAPDVSVSEVDATPQIPVPVVETAVVVTVTANPVQAEPMPETKPVWPELTLTGIAQGDGQSLAILNGKMLSAGRKLGAVTLVEVTESAVVVEYLGERRTLYIGE